MSSGTLSLPGRNNPSSAPSATEKPTAPGLPQTPPMKLGDMPSRQPATASSQQVKPAESVAQKSPTTETAAAAPAVPAVAKTEATEKPAAAAAAAAAASAEKPKKQKKETAPVLPDFDEKPWEVKAAKTKKVADGASVSSALLEQTLAAQAKAKMIDAWQKMRDYQKAADEKSEVARLAIDAMKEELIKDLNAKTPLGVLYVRFVAVAGNVLSKPAFKETVLNLPGVLPEAKKSFEEKTAKARASALKRAENAKAKPKTSTAQIEK